MPSIRRTSTSRRDYAAIWDYVAEHASPETADALLRAFDSKLALLAQLPGVGQACPELRPRLRRFPVGRYLLFYRPTRDGIELIRVLHGARDVRRIFRRRPQ
jgi:toxin ParE1/3/4